MNIKMKKNKSIYLGMAAAMMAAVMSACQADMDTPGLDVPAATLEANTSILDLKLAAENGISDSNSKFYDESDPTRTLVGTREDGSHYIVKGRVVSNDATGNIYKSLVIQDETAALAFSINQQSMYVDYRPGQEVVVDITGLRMGYYRGLLQVGALSEPYNGENQLGFMAWPLWLEHSQKNGAPKPETKVVEQGGAYPADECYYVITDLPLPGAGEAMLKMQSQLVEIRDCSFVDGGKEPYAVYEESVNRTLKTASGQTIDVRNSGYSNFYTDTIPAGHGTVRGILGYYGDSWQLTLRGPEDVMISTKGDADDPYTVEDVLNPDNMGMSGWTSAYIVGSVKAGVSHVTKNDDIIFGANAEMDDNLVLAASPDETDYTKCITLALPQKTQLRTYGNLVDNPKVYKRAIKVNATIGEFYGMTGLIQCAGGSDSFEIEGVDPNAPIPAPDAKGSGTEADPYNIGAVMRSTSDMSGVWVEGYIVGYVSDMNWSGSAVWSADPTAGSSNYLNNSNVILSEYAPGQAAASNSVPASLTSAVKKQIGLQANPSAFGKKVKVKCNIAEYMGTRAIRNISEVK